MSSILFKAETPKPEALLIMFHGVGGSPIALQSLGKFLNSDIPGLQVSIPRGFAPSTISSGGYQWFDIVGVTEENRPARVQNELPEFDKLIKEQAKQTGIPLEKVVLLGFSQGTIMSLEWLKQSEITVAGIIGIAGRFATLPEQSPAIDTAVCLIHGEEDAVIDINHARQSHQHLTNVGINCELHPLVDTPHAITKAMCPIISEFIQRVI